MMSSLNHKASSFITKNNKWIKLLKEWICRKKFDKNNKIIFFEINFMFNKFICYNILKFFLLNSKI